MAYHLVKFHILKLDYSIISAILVVRDTIAMKMECKLVPSIWRLAPCLYFKKSNFRQLLMTISLLGVVVGDLFLDKIFRPYLLSPLCW